MANQPHVWLKAAVESAYEGLTAWPVENTAGVGEAGYDPPYAIYRREATERTKTVDDDIDDEPTPSQIPPRAMFTIEVFADTYASVWQIANAVIAAIDGFRGEAEGETIEMAWVEDATDGDVVILDGREQPTYAVEIPVAVTFKE
jgi:hypothetical protein